MLDFFTRNALLSQDAIENEAWRRGRGSDRLRENPAAASLTLLLTGAGED